MFRSFFSAAQSTAEDPPEDGREKRPKHVGVLYLQTRFQHFIGFKC